MKYLVIELQTNGGVVGNVINDYDNLAEAENRYYTVLAAASVSAVEIHTAMLVKSNGEIIHVDSRTHAVEPTE